MLITIADKPRRRRGSLRIQDRVSHSPVGHDMYSTYLSIRVRYQGFRRDSCLRIDIIRDLRFLCRQGNRI
jgi:hypothetical protein